ncbi:MAG: PAS domain S-box protein [Elusimicrobia bacterium]|nr:PAS domain S-box protein [Elusimicrobiota bacterium]
MRLDSRLLLLFVVVSLVFARLISASSRSAVHAVLIEKLEAPALVRTGEIKASMDVGLRSGDEAELLGEYLRGCLGSYGASYAAALDKDGRVVLIERVSGLGPAPGSFAETGATEHGGRPVHQLIVTSSRGALLLGWDLSEALRTEQDIAVKIFLYTSLAGGLALVLLFFLMRDLVRRFDKMSGDILDQLRDGVFVIDGEGKIRTVNPALLKMLGYGERELIGRPASVLLAAGAGGALLAPVENAELRLRRQDGGFVPVLLSVSLLREGAGAPSGIICAVRDVTELKRKDAELKEREALLRSADKLSAVGRLAAGIAHEINNPLGSILGFAQAAAARLKPSEALSMPLRAIEEEALRCRSLVKSLLSFSREGRDALEELELAPVIEGTLGVIEAQARVRGVPIAREFAAGSRALGDRGQIQQIVMNLCTNALDAMPDGGTLTVRCGVRGANVYIEVQDEGPGIPEDIRGRIFDPFFTTKDVGQGTGLGLSLVHEIVVRHRGTVSASDAPGGGTLMRVELPAAS